jgi:membrane-associated phospholipid phosphatase
MPEMHADPPAPNGRDDPNELVPLPDLANGRSDARGGLAMAPVLDAAAARRTIWRLVALGAASATLTAAIYGLTVWTPLGQLMSELILGGRFGSPDAIRGAEQILGTLSRATLVAGGVAVIALALLQRREALAVVAAVSILGANVTAQVLKSAVLDRADLLDRLFYVLPNSFPSGHVTAAASVAVALVLVLPPLLRSLTVVLASVAVVVVGASAMLAGWHRMADAIGGVFVATAWASFLTALLVWRRGAVPVGRRTAALGRISGRILLVVGMATLALGSLAYLLVLVDPLGVLIDLAERGGSPALLMVGLLISAGASLLALGAFGLAIREVRLDPPQRPSQPLPTNQPDPRTSPA